MKNKAIVTAVVGLAIGFIFGFFAGQYSAGTGPAGVPPAQAAGEGLPQEHPSPEKMEEVRSLVEQVEANPQDREARVRLGNLLYDMERFDSAIVHYEQALAMNPSDVHVSTDLGTCYLYTGQVEKALEQYQKSLTIEPDHAQTLQNMGIAHFSTGDYQKAIEVWEQLVQNRPNYERIDDVKKQIETARRHLTTAASAP